MTARGVHFALTLDEVDALRRCPSDVARLELLQEEIEETLFDEAPERVCETDKAWEPIHRGLTAGGESGAAALAVLGGESLYAGDDCLLLLKSLAEVRAVSTHLEDVTEETLCASLAASADIDFPYVWAWFEKLQAFYARAAANECHVLFSVL